ncbi:hypothetical protein BH20ACI4_BH20ACI4_12080 [soil metagenome]
MSSQIKLQQPVINGSLRSTNFFNGRLVTGADMSREQTARREADWRTGKANGDGIVSGLKVEEAAGSGGEPVVNVTQGLAVNRCGQTLYLAQNAAINLLQRFGTIENPSKIFADCQPIQTGTYTAGFKFYLLVLSPAETKEGSAPTGGLNNAVVTCNTDMILETVQFRLLPVDPFLINENLPDAQLRNYIAYRCFGTARTNNFFKDPFGFSLENYGLMDEMRGKTLSDSDVPLAIINWTSAGLKFVEMWSVRRRVTRRIEDKNWTQLTNDRRLSETEAMMRQFARQIEESQPTQNKYRTVQAIDYFRYLPPAGILPQAATQIGNGFELENFFKNKRLNDIAMIDGAQLQPLLREALTHEPIDLHSDEKIQIYFVRENFDAVQSGQIKQFSVVFAKRTIPYHGTARFNAELSNWNLSRYV